MCPAPRRQTAKKTTILENLSREFIAIVAGSNICTLTTLELLFTLFYNFVLLYPLIKFFNPIAIF